MVAKLEIANERLKKDIGWKELVQTRDSLLDKARIRNPLNVANRLVSAARQGKYTYKKAGEEHVEFPNEIKGNWNATRPVEIVVSDMTIFKNNGRSWEWTLLVDTFNNEILAHQATPIQGSTKPYYHCLEQLKLLAGKKNEEQTPQVVAHRPGFCLPLTSLPTGSRTL